MSAITVTVSTSPANRKEIAEAFGGNQSAVRRIESLTRDVTVTLPDAVGSVSDMAAQALALAQALQQLAFVLVSASTEAPNGVALGAEGPVVITPGAGTLTISLQLPLNVAYGGTGGTTGPQARINLGAASSGANSDITSLTGLTTPLGTTEGGTGVATLTPDGVVYGNGGGPLQATSAGTAGQVLVSNGLGNAPTFSSTPTLQPTITGGTIDGTDVGDTTPAKGTFTQIKNGDTVLMRTSAALPNGGASATATLTNAPVAGNPTKWVPINDNGTTRYIPAW